MADLEKMVDAIESTGVATVLKSFGDAGSARLLCRVSDKKAWCSILEFVLTKKSGWTEHVCQQYFLRDGKLVYGWNVIVNATDIDKAIDNAAKLFRDAGNRTPATSTGSTDTMPLIGAVRTKGGAVFDPRMPGPSRGGPSHKGAYPIGSND